MERYLTSGTEIKLKGIDGRYIIKDIIGRGSSCVVYSADFYNNNNEKTEHLLKEFNPRCIDLKRDAGVLTTTKDAEKELFESLCNRFKEGFERQAELRTTPELKNYTANIQNTYYDNGTIYIDMTETNGKPYADVEEKSIYNLAQRIRVLAQVIGNYHKHGYLHLDIKPSNIFVRPEDETCQDVLLFDFDSLVPFSEENGKCVIDENVSVSYTTEYAPIELLTASRRGRICKATDIYEIGEIFFEKLMGRHSTALEHNVWSDYEYNRSAQIFENVNPKVPPLLNELFTHTLCNDASMRYQSIEELIKCLDKIIELSNPKEPFLKSSLPNVSGFFTGRDSEIEEIHKRLQENNVLFLRGIGGIGKSELAKHYAKKYKSEYDAIIFAPFDNDVQMMIADDSYVQIHNFFRYPEEKPNEYFERKMQELAKLCDERTLIIVDNFDTTEDENLEQLLSLNCKMLVTTRRDFSEAYTDSQLDLGTLANPFEVFDEYYKKPLSEDERECVDEIIEIVCGHTMTVELLAKQMMAGRVKPEKMLEKIKSGGISESGKEKVIHANEKGEVSRENTYDHIQTLFDLSDLDEDEKYVLANLSLIPHTGIHAELFGEWCEIDNFDTINNLAIEGWIRWDREKDFISLHPLISNACLSYQKDCCVFSIFIRNIDKCIAVEKVCNYDEISRNISLVINIFSCVKRFGLNTATFFSFLWNSQRWLDDNTTMRNIVEDIIEYVILYEEGVSPELYCRRIGLLISVLQYNISCFGDEIQRKDKIVYWREKYSNISRDTYFNTKGTCNTIQEKTSKLSSLILYYQDIGDKENEFSAYRQLVNTYESASSGELDILYKNEDSFENIFFDIATAYEKLGLYDKAIAIHIKSLNSIPCGMDTKHLWDKERIYQSLLSCLMLSENWVLQKKISYEYYEWAAEIYPKNHAKFLYAIENLLVAQASSLMTCFTDEEFQEFPDGMYDVCFEFGTTFQMFCEICEKFASYSLANYMTDILSGVAHMIYGYVLLFLERTANDYEGKEMPPTDMDNQRATYLLSIAKLLFRKVKNQEYIDSVTDIEKYLNSISKK